MALSNAVLLANIASGDALTVDTTNDRVGVGSTTPDVTLDVIGIISATSFSGDGSLLTNVGFDTSYISGVAATFTGNVTVGGVLTYEDVANVDSVGIITAQTGVRVLAGGVGIAESIFHLSDQDTKIGFPAADTFTVETAGSERLRVDSTGNILAKTIDVRIGSDVGAIEYGTSANNSVRFYQNNTEYLRIDSGGAFGLSGSNYGTAGQIITSNGSSAAPTWEDASGGGGITTEAQVKTTGQTALLDLSNAIDHKVTCTGTVTIDATGGTQEGESHTVRIVNNGTATVGFSTYFLFPSGSVPSLPTADGAISLISFTVHRKGATGISTQLLSGSSVNFS